MPSVVTDFPSRQVNNFTKRKEESLRKVAIPNIAGTVLEDCNFEAENVRYILFHLMSSKYSLKKSFSDGVFNDCGVCVIGSSKASWHTAFSSSTTRAGYEELVLNVDIELFTSLVCSSRLI